MVMVLGCNAVGLGDMATSEKEIIQRFTEAKIKHFSTGFIGPDKEKIFFAQATNLDVTDTTPVFIFAHGTPGALGNSMAYLLDSILLLKGIVVAYDRPGFGLSDGGESKVDLGAQVAGLKRLMDEYSNRKIFLIGHSYGAPVILQAAMDYPEKIVGLVWLGGVVQTAWREHAWWRKPISYPPFKWFAPASMRVSNQEIIHLEEGLEKIEGRWDEVTCPVIMIQGTDDWLAVPSNTTYADSMLVAARFKETVIVPDASHFFYFFKPEYVVNALVKLLGVLEE